MMSAELVVESQSESDTDRLGTLLAEGLETGLTIALSGQLGSGKTRFVRAVCKGLGVDVSRVNSPTFVLMQLYQDGRIPVAHFDTYRLADSEEFLAIGADEYLESPEFISVVEWADRIAEILPADRLEIDIQQTAERSRQFCLRATGPVSAAVIEHFNRARTASPQPRGNAS